MLCVPGVCSNKASNEQQWYCVESHLISSSFGYTTWCQKWLDPKISTKEVYRDGDSVISQRCGRWALICRLKMSEKERAAAQLTRRRLLLWELPSAYSHRSRLILQSPMSGRDGYGGSSGSVRQASWQQTPMTIRWTHSYICNNNYEYKPWKWFISCYSEPIFAC